MTSLYQVLYSRLKSFNQSQQFIPTVFSLFTNSTYIMKRGVYLGVKNKSSAMLGDLLDVGCGSAPYRRVFNVESYTGIDLNLSPVSNLREVQYCHFDGNRIPFSPGSFSCVLATEVFEHVFNLPSLLEEIARVSKEGATLLCTLPFVWPEHDEPFDFARYTSFGIANIIERAGYEIVEVKKHGTYSDVVIQLLINYMDAQYKKLGFLGLILRVFTCTTFNTLAAILNVILPNIDKLYLGVIVEARLHKKTYCEV